MNTHCKIGKVRLKNGADLVVLDKPEDDIVSDSLHEFATQARKDEAVTCGAFYIRKNLTVYTCCIADKGTTKLHTVGGATMLLNHFQELENDWGK